MTEADVDGIISEGSELRGDSRLIILLGAPEGIKGVSRKLSSLQGAKRIRKGVYIVHGYSETHEMVLSSQPVISFSKTKKIPTSRARSEEALSNRVYSLVAFSFNTPTAQQKKHVERLIRKTTGVRVRPGVVLFPLHRSKERRRILGSEEERVLIDSKEFSRLICENGGNSLRWSRLGIVNLNGIDHVKNAIEQTLSRDLTPLEEKIRTLRERCKDPAVPIRQLKKKYTVLSRRFRKLRTKWMLARKLWFYDAEKQLKRSYNMLINTRRAIIEEEARRMS